MPAPVCASCQVNLAELNPLFKKQYKKLYDSYLKKNKIVDEDIAKGQINIECGPIYDDLRISVDRYCCRATLLTSVSTLDMLKMDKPFDRTTK